jgi:hypothetical protein
MSAPTKAPSSRIAVSIASACAPLKLAFPGLLSSWPDQPMYRINHPRRKSTHIVGIPLNKALHYLDLTENTLVVSVQDTTEGSEHGKEDDLSISEKTSPALVLVLNEDGVEIASGSCSTCHVVAVKVYGLMGRL